MQMLSLIPTILCRTEDYNETKPGYFLQVIAHQKHQQCEASDAVVLCPLWDCNYFVLVLWYIGLHSPFTA